MARTGPTSPDDYNHVIKQTGAFSIGMKQALIRTNRLQTGKTVNTTITNTTQTAAVVPELAFRLVKGKRYRIVGKLFTAGTGGTGGIKVGFAYSGSSATPTLVNKYISASAIAATSLATVNSMDAGAAVAALEVDIDGLITADVRGTLQLQFANTTGAQAATILPGSWLVVLRV